MQDLEAHKMDTKNLVKEIQKWTTAHKFGGDVRYRKTRTSYVVEFFMDTTMTRASSIVTRLRLIVEELAKGTKFNVGKMCQGLPPKERSALARWRIFVHVPIKEG